MGWGGIFSAHSAIDSDFGVDNTVPDLSVRRTYLTLSPTFEWLIILKPIDTAVAIAICTCALESIAPYIC